VLGVGGVIRDVGEVIGEIDGLAHGVGDFVCEVGDVGMTLATSFEVDGMNVFPNPVPPGRRKEGSESRVGVDFPQSEKRGVRKEGAERVGVGRSRLSPKRVIPPPIS